MSARTPEEELASEVIAALFASAVTKRFEVLAGDKLLCSPIVFLAALEVARVIFGPTENPLRALDEVEELETRLREVGGAV